VTHRDAVVDGDGVELSRHSTGCSDGIGDDFADVLEMNVSGYELGIRIGNGHNRFAEVLIGHPGRPPE
jgi:hypothetical protein